MRPSYKYLFNEQKMDKYVETCLVRGNNQDLLYDRS